MPVKTKRNVKKQRNETSQEMYSNNFIDDDVSPAYTPPPTFRPLSPLSDPEPDSGIDTMTDGTDQAYYHPTLEEEDKPGDPEPSLAQYALPAVVAQPLPVPPQAPRISVETQPPSRGGGSPNVYQIGHVRSPTLAREPSTLESFSRTIRGYVPSSIPIPSASPTPPRVSRPVSFGSFLSPSRAITPATPPSRVLSPRARDAGTYHRRHLSERRHQFADDELESVVFNLDEDDSSALPHTKYPSSEQGEEIVWSKWDSLPAAGGISRRPALILGYRNGLQIWDCTDMGAISEVLNLKGAPFADIIQAQILPTPVPDPMAEQRPLLALLHSARGVEELLIYSLRAHRIVRTLTFSSLVSFAASSQFLTLATSHPPALHVLSSRTFEPLHTVPSSNILPFIHTYTSESTNIVSSEPLEQETTSTAIPQPVFTSYNRLLAFASVPASSLSPAQSSSSSALRTAVQGSPPDAPLKLQLSQAELGNAALRIGGSVLSGMKVLGGMAFTAARAGVSAAMATDYHGIATTNHSPPAPGKFFSRSAPAASGRGEAFPEPFSPTSDLAARKTPDQPPGSPPYRDKPARPKDGYTVTVYDLEPVLSGTKTAPRLVAEFVAARDQPISKLAFSEDGTSLIVATKDGQTMKVFKLRPVPSVMSRGKFYNRGQRRGSAGHLVAETEERVNSPMHVYDLKRGRTSGVVETMNWADDGRWVAVGTRNRTIHVFATNPYGGPSDDSSHLEGKVVNVRDSQPLSTELDPILRLRALKPRRAEQRLLPLAFTFISRSTLFLSQPPPSHGFSPSSSPSSGRSNSVSPKLSAERNGEEQDVLVFDPNDGMLSLRRLTPSKRAQDSASHLPVPAPRVNTSISLPGVSTIHRFASATQSSEGARQPSGLTRMMGGSSRLACQESHIATWILRRNADWKQIKRSLKVVVIPTAAIGLSKSDWLAQAELSTCSRSPRLVPRSIYLKHQFSFFYLGEDYHALLRSHHLDVSATKIEVRRQVEVSASSAGVGETFVSGSSLPSHAAFPSSFDEPLASALSAELRNNNPSPPVIPMYPNGPVSRSLRPAIPIRNVAAGISDGMSEGIVRLRREIGKVRSPRLLPRSGDSVSASVPLEFDEEDEDFLSLDANQPGRDSRATSREGASVSTPSTGIEPLPAENDGDISWEGWSSEDKQAVDDLEQFNDIGVGYMDEEWPHAVRSRHET